jgi:acetyltransferase-like isoleucine patch superfamily enzyme
MKTLLLTAIKRFLFLLARPMILFYAMLAGNAKLAMKIEWKYKHGYLNVWKTFLVNFTSFKFSIANKLPILVYEKLDFINTGKIIIDTEKVERGMLVINDVTWRSKSVTRLEIHGELHLCGNQIRIFGGGNYIVHPHGVLIFGGKNNFGENVIMYCEKEIKIGLNSTCAFNSVLIDANSHYTLNINEGKTSTIQKNIEIGDYNWIGNNTSVKPGTKTPHHTIVASSSSVLSKDYTKLVAPYSILGGCPAKVLKEGYSRVWNKKYENLLYRLDKEHKDLYIPQQDILQSIVAE